MKRDAAVLVEGEGLGGNGAAVGQLEVSRGLGVEAAPGSVLDQADRDAGPMRKKARAAGSAAAKKEAERIDEAHGGDGAGAGWGPGGGGAGRCGGSVPCMVPVTQCPGPQSERGPLRALFR